MSASATASRGGKRPAFQKRVEEETKAISNAVNRDRHVAADELCLAHHAVVQRAECADQRAATSPARTVMSWPGTLIQPGTPAGRLPPLRETSRPIARSLPGHLVVLVQQIACGSVLVQGQHRVKVAILIPKVLAPARSCYLWQEPGASPAVLVCSRRTPDPDELDLPFSPVRASTAPSLLSRPARTLIVLLVVQAGPVCLRSSAVLLIEQAQRRPVLVHCQRCAYVPSSSAKLRARTSAGRAQARQVATHANATPAAHHQPDTFDASTWRVPGSPAVPHGYAARAMTLSKCKLRCAELTLRFPRPSL